MQGKTFDQSLERVLAYRERGRRRPAWARAGLAVAGLVLLVLSVPLVVVLPEAGVPALLVGLRLLAVEADWAARAYAWIDWRFALAMAWFRRQPRPVRSLVLLALLVVGVALVWLLVHQFA